MKTATSLALLAIGAILAFAITRSPAFLNLQIVGWVLMLTGAAGALVPRRGNGWLRRRLIVKTDETDGEPERMPERQRYSRLLAPGGLLGSRRGALQPTGQVEREMIEEYIEE